MDELNGTGMSPNKRESLWIRKKVLHVIVGHGLRTYFLNAVRSDAGGRPGRSRSWSSTTPVQIRLSARI